MAGVVLIEQLREAADIVGATDRDSSPLRKHGVEEESIAEFVKATEFVATDGVPLLLDPVSLAMGLIVGIVARDRLGGA